jgi:pyruvate formate lyase activating enzyme
MSKRGLLYFTLSEIEPRVWFMLTGCDFRCKGCFRPARDGGGTLLTAEETLARMEQACRSYYGKIPREAMITGGEPALEKEYLLGLVRGLRARGFEKIVLMTNGYALGEDSNYVAELQAAGLTEAHVDLKAFSEEIHQWYTGKSNQPVLRAIARLSASGIKLLVQTVYMPGLVETEEIARIAQFLASINPEIGYRINPFVPVFAYEKVTRRPTLSEIERAYEVASKYLPNAIVSRSCYREYPTPPPQKTWITVYPDLTVKRRGMKDQMEDRLAWLSRTRAGESAEAWQQEAWDFSLRHSLVGISDSTRNEEQERGELEGSSTVRVKFPQALHGLTQTKWTELECNGSRTVEEILRELTERYGNKFRETVLDTGAEGNIAIKRSFNVYLNGMNIKNRQGMQTEVHGNDELIILSWVSGG